MFVLTAIFFLPLSHQGLFQNLCPSVPGGSVCQWKALGNTSLERWPARLLCPHACQHIWPLPGSHWNVFTAAFHSHSSFAPRLEPTLELAGGHLGPRAPHLWLPPFCFPSVYFLVGRNKVTNQDAVTFPGNVRHHKCTHPDSKASVSETSFKFSDKTPICSFLSPWN